MLFSFLILFALFPLSAYCMLLDAAVRGQFGYLGDRAVGKAYKGKVEEIEKEEERGECMGECRCH
jgi:hypothetical protein